MGGPRAGVAEQRRVHLTQGQLKRSSMGREGGAGAGKRKRFDITAEANSREE